ncbi:S-layer family protein [Paenibacillus taihuensis]|uniref:S-layer family protein n=1 Tax=Paenibacillus taihuensis TaxID=1156355 RepID=A0A3D9SGZ2_9BACL|nr:S-layer homology domain-containing protein [Paenibacillus taihuensis]REE90511.1 S-layer family protein [Paenibacillus taihuensis]
MKKLIMNKTAAVLVFAMMISVLTPIIAFAAQFNNVSVSGNTVTGDVYLTQDEYNALADQSRISVNVYDAAGNVVTNVYATYTNDGLFHFTYTLDRTGYLGYDNVTTGTYTYSGGNNNIIFVPTTPDVVNTDGTVNRDALIALFGANADATVTSKSEVVSLPADALLKGKSLTIKLEDGTSYTLPIAALKLEDLAKSLGVELKDLTIRVELKKVTGDTATKIAGAATAVGGEQVAPAVDFKVVAVAGSKEQTIENFGQYVSRTIPVTASDAAGLTGVLYNPVTGTFTFVPSTFATVDGKTLATLKRNGNSIYTVIKTKAASFADLAGHWAQKDVEALAGKLIVEGTGANKFEPKRDITRAEFAALVVRALGLEVGGTSDKFKDVASDKWFASTVASAVKAGLITGYEDGTFKPNANITRKEMAAIVVRAMKLAGKDVAISDADVSKALASFTDASSLGWAKDEVAVAINAGVVKGQTSTKVVGDANANRAEAATMIARFLGKVGFIN